MTGTHDFAAFHAQSSPRRPRTLWCAATAELGLSEEVFADQPQAAEDEPEASEAAAAEPEVEAAAPSDEAPADESPAEEASGGDDAPADETPAEVSAPDPGDGTADEG